MRRNTNPKALNEAEPRPAMILRLLSEAQQGQPCAVSIAEAMEFRRHQYGLKASEFAAILGLTAPHYSEMASGKRNFPLNARIRAYAIGVPAEVLLQHETEMVKAKAGEGPRASKATKAP